MSELGIENYTAESDSLLMSEIAQLLRNKNALLLAHFYQDSRIQDLAHFTGDSLQLARLATASKNEIIVFAGVRFMAETIKVLNPNKKIIVPDLNASCSLSDSCSAKDFQKFIDKYPDHIKVTYINSSVEVKALSDFICTSSNAEETINRIPKNKPIIFSPDKNLGNYLEKKTGRSLVLWDGTCIVHESFEFNKIIKLLQSYPKAKIIAHPESESQILKISSFIGSTSSLLRFVETDDAQTYIVATEVGILHRMRQRLPEKLFIPAPIKENNSCACSECAFMKLNSLEKLYKCLRTEGPEIKLSEEVRLKALKPLQHMLN